MPNINIKKTIEEIIDNQANEGPTLDYKVQEDISGKRKDEILKDTLAMLNSIEALTEDKYIIFGVNDKKMLIGLKSEFRDDNEYQNIFNAINPRPSIETGTIIIEDKSIGYIHIKKGNEEWPYEIAKDTGKHLCGTSFTRIGSTTIPLTQQHREKLAEKRKIIQEISSNGSYHPIYRGIEFQNSIKNTIDYTNRMNQGSAQMNPSLNNGRYTIGEGQNEFVLKIEVPANDIARIYNDSGIKVARIRGGRKLWGKVDKIDFKNLNFSNRVAESTYEDLVYIVNKNDRALLWKVTQADSEYHDRDIDHISFEWKMLTLFTK